MFGLFGGLSSLTRILVTVGTIVALAGSLYGGYRYWRHSVWVEGKDAALEAVRKQNAVAGQAAQKVDLSIDQCFEQGGDWNVTTGKCDL